MQMKNQFKYLNNHPPSYRSAMFRHNSSEMGGNQPDLVHSPSGVNYSEQEPPQGAFYSRINFQIHLKCLKMVWITSIFCSALLHLSAFFSPHWAGHSFESRNEGHFGLWKFCAISTHHTALIAPADVVSSHDGKFDDSSSSKSHQLSIRTSSIELAKFDVGAGRADNVFNDHYQNKNLEDHLICSGSLNDFSSILSPTFRAATLFAAFATLLQLFSSLIITLCGLKSLLVKIIFSNCMMGASSSSKGSGVVVDDDHHRHHALAPFESNSFSSKTTIFEGIGWMQIVSGICLGVSLIAFPVGWDNEFVRSVCGSQTKEFNPGSCTVRWAFVLAVICVCNSLFIATFSFTIARRSKQLCKWMSFVRRHRNSNGVSVPEGGGLFHHYPNGSGNGQQAMAGGPSTGYSHTTGAQHPVQHQQETLYTVQPPSTPGLYYGNETDVAETHENNLERGGHIPNMHAFETGGVNSQKRPRPPSYHNKY